MRKTGKARPRALRVMLFVLGAAVACAQSAQPAPPKEAERYAGMVRIPAGEFTMGRSGGLPEEGPPHRVVLPTYYIDRDLVTWADYLPFIQAKGPTGPAGEMYLDVDDHDAKIRKKGGTWSVEKGFEKYPASEMAWAGAVAFCRWKKKNLPTEAQWEKAARGTDGRLFPWGDAKPSAERQHLGDYPGHTAEVGRYPKGASPYGVNDMAGQVWEWTSSLALPYPYTPKDGRENTGATGERTLRGGNSSSLPDGMTTTSREVIGIGRQESGHGYIGFRCAVSAPPSI